MEELLGLPHLRALQMPHFGGQPLNRTGDYPQGAEESGVPVARNDLGGDRFSPQSQPLRHVLLNAWIQMCERADRAADRGDRNFGACGQQSLAVAGEFRVVPCQLQSKGRGFCMDAMAAADGDGVFMLDRPRLQRSHHRVNISQQDVRGLGQLHRQRRIQNIGTGHALMDEPASQDRLLRPAR